MQNAASLTCFDYFTSCFLSCILCDCKKAIPYPKGPYFTQEQIQQFYCSSDEESDEDENESFIKTVTRGNSDWELLDTPKNTVFGYLKRGPDVDNVIYNAELLSPSPNCACQININEIEKDEDELHAEHTNDKDFYWDEEE